MWSSWPCNIQGILILNVPRVLEVSFNVVQIITVWNFFPYGGEFFNISTADLAHNKYASVCVFPF